MFNRWFINTWSLEEIDRGERHETRFRLPADITFDLAGDGLAIAYPVLSGDLRLDEDFNGSVARVNVNDVGLEPDDATRILSAIYDEIGCDMDGGGSMKPIDLHQWLALVLADHRRGCEI